MIKQCLFPAAGLGTRFLPITKSIPKEMIAIVNKPLIQYGVEEAYQAGITHISIVTSRGKYAIENYFDHNYELEERIKNSSKLSKLKELNQLIDQLEFSYCRQKEPQGLGHAILEGKHLVGSNSAFCVLLADDLCVGENGKNVLKQMLEVHQKYPEHYIVAVEDVAINQIDQYGIVSGTILEEGVIEIESMIEKPSLGTVSSNLAIIGRYILQPQIFDNIDKTARESLPDQEIQITEAISQAIKDRKVIGYRFQGKRFDCGSQMGYLEAIHHFSRELLN